MPPSHPGVLTTLNVSTEFLKSEVASSCNSVTELFLRNTSSLFRHFFSTPAWRRYGISLSTPAWRRYGISLSTPAWRRYGIFFRRQHGVATVFPPFPLLGQERLWNKIHAPHYKARSETNRLSWLKWATIPEHLDSVTYV